MYTSNADITTQWADFVYKQHSSIQDWKFEHYINDDFDMFGVRAYHNMNKDDSVIGA